MNIIYDCAVLLHTYIYFAHLNLVNSPQSGHEISCLKSLVFHTSRKWYLKRLVNEEYPAIYCQIGYYVRNLTSWGHIVCVKCLYFIPSPQYIVLTHHSFVVSYNMFRLIKPSSGI
jgi:hypothetical protein